MEGFSGVGYFTVGNELEDCIIVKDIGVGSVIDAYRFELVIGA